MNKHDAIVIGAGHNGLTAAAYLAKAGLDVVVLEKNDYIGGAAVTREMHEGWFYSSCSYVCSMMRQAIHRDLDLTRHGLLLVPYLGTVNFSDTGDRVLADSLFDPDLPFFLLLPPFTARATNWLPCRSKLIVGEHPLLADRRPSNQ